MQAQKSLHLRQGVRTLHLNIHCQLTIAQWFKLVGQIGGLTTLNRSWFVEDFPF